ncbi:MAG: hypothetical protein QM728_05535 [Gordonia sp. (in: high G+C Gram-positive bacteria)]|uniref:hypothetical protein n=1 Tax=Gordonia sp. (in: high G+C Gram-positive bacteria) TaxID=84139 RepID=UPI0039E57DBD
MPDEWQRFERRGEVVARKRFTPWTWTTSTGEEMTAEPGDWEVRPSADEPAWSVREDIFEASYEQVEGDRYRRVGVVRARPARAGEVVRTLEGDVPTRAGDWIVAGDGGEQWPVPAAEFEQRYRPSG